MNNITCNILDVQNDLILNNPLVFNNVYNKTIIGNNYSLLNNNLTINNSNYIIIIEFKNITSRIIIDRSNNINISNINNLLSPLSFINDKNVTLQNVLINSSRFIFLYSRNILISNIHVHNSIIDFNYSYPIYLINSTINESNVYLDYNEFYLINSTIDYSYVYLNNNDEYITDSKIIRTGMYKRDNELNMSNNYILDSFISTDESGLFLLLNIMNNSTLLTRDSTRLNITGIFLDRSELEIRDINADEIYYLNYVFSNNSRIKITKRSTAYEPVNISNIFGQNLDITIYNAEVSIDNMIVFYDDPYYDIFVDEGEVYINNGTIINQSSIWISDSSLYIDNSNLSSTYIYGRKIIPTNTFFINSSLEIKYIKAKNCSFVSYSRLEVEKDSEIEESMFDNTSILVLKYLSSNSYISSSLFYSPIYILYPEPYTRIKIYNNIFILNGPYLYINGSNDYIYLNTSESYETSIIGTPKLGGNYWARPDGTGYSQTCSDLDQDNICDIPYNLSNIYDYLPLTNNTQFSSCDVYNEIQLINAIENTSCNLISINANIYLTSNINISRPLVLYSNNKILSSNNLLIIDSEYVMLYNLTLDLNLDIKNRGNIKLMYIQQNKYNNIINSNVKILNSKINYDTKFLNSIIYINNTELIGNISAMNSTLSINSSLINSYILSNRTYIQIASSYINDSYLLFEYSNPILNNNVIDKSSITIKGFLSGSIYDSYIINSTINSYNSSTLKIYRNIINQMQLNTDDSGKVIIFDNIINNTLNASNNSIVYLNKSLVIGLSIINTTFIGGNYWIRPDGTGYSQTCSDVDQDNICDTPYTIDGLTDYYPLTYTVSPVICEVGNFTQFVDALNNISCKIVRLIQNIEIPINYVYLSNQPFKLIDGNEYMLTSIYSRSIYFINFSNLGIYRLTVPYSITIYTYNISNLSITNTTIIYSFISTNTSYAYLNRALLKSLSTDFSTIKYIEVEDTTFHILTIFNNQRTSIIDSHGDYLRLGRTNSSIIVNSHLGSIEIRDSNNVNIINSDIGFKTWITSTIMNSTVSISYCNLYTAFRTDRSNVSLTNSSIILCRVPWLCNFIIENSNVWIYNNIINFNVTSLFNVISSNVYLNTSLQNQTSIIGTPKLGGNYWIRPDGTGYSQTCSDVDQDNICDTPYTINGLTDYYPLTKLLSPINISASILVNNTITTSTANVTAKFDIFSNTSINRYEIYLNNNLISNNSTNSPNISFQHTFANLTPATYVIKLNVFSNNSMITKSATFTVHGVPASTNNTLASYYDSSFEARGDFQTNTYINQYWLNLSLNDSISWNVDLIINNTIVNSTNGSGSSFISLYYFYNEYNYTYKFNVTYFLNNTVIKVSYGEYRVISDGEAPTLEIINISNYSTTSQIYLPIQFNATDNIMLSSYDLYLNGSLIITNNSVQSNINTIHLWLGPGVYNIYIVVFDGAGNSNNSSALFYITKISLEANYSSREAFVSNISNNNYWLNISVNDSVNWTVELIIDQNVVNSSNGYGSLFVDLWYEHNNSVITYYMFKVNYYLNGTEAVDYIGPYNITIDIKPPYINITRPINGSTISPGAVNISFVAIDDLNVSMMCYYNLTGTLNISNSSIVNNNSLYSNILTLPQGNYTIQVSCNDGLNSRSSSISFIVLLSSSGSNQPSQSDTTNQSETLNISNVSSNVTQNISNVSNNVSNISSYISNTSPSISNISLNQTYEVQNTSNETEVIVEKPSTGEQKEPTEQPETKEDESPKPEPKEQESQAKSNQEMIEVSSGTTILLILLIILAIIFIALMKFKKR